MSQKNFRIVFVASAAFVLLSSGHGWSQTLEVTSLEDSGPGSLRDVVTNAPDGVVVTFSPLVQGNVVLDSRIWIRHNLTIKGPRDGSVMLVGKNYIQQPNSSPLLGIDTLKTVLLSNLVMIGGAGGEVPGGGGIYNRGTLYLDSCKISDCTLYGPLQLFDPKNGSGIYNSGVLVARDCQFRRNSFEALYNTGLAHLTRCTFSGNTALSGGGVNNTGTLEAQACAFTSNSCTAADFGNGTLKPAYGGALNNSGTATLVNCTLSGNSVWGVDGYVSQPVHPYVYRVPSYGGGVYNAPTGKVNLIYCTLTANSADHSYLGGGPPSNGGGIYNDKGELRLVNTIIAGNGGSVEALDLAGSTTSASHSLIGQLTYPDSIVGLPSNSNLYGNSTQVLDPHFGILSEHGGETQVWSLQSESPAIGFALALDSITVDQRGYARRTPPDIGAYAYDPVFSTVPVDPDPISPVRDARVAADTSIFAWHRGFGATSHHLLIASDSLFSGVVVDLNGLESNSVQTVALPGDSRLFWKVAGRNSLGEGPFSSVNVFHTGHRLAIPDSIILVGPDSAVYHTMYINFRWHPSQNALWYHVTLRCYGTLRYDSSQYSDTAITVGVAWGDKEYEFSVFGANPEATGKSSVVAFQTSGIPPPVSPEPLFPPDGTTAPPNVILRWSESRQNTYPMGFDNGFELQIETDTVGAGPYPNRFVYGPEYDPKTLPYGNFAVGQTYFWRVRAKVEGRSGAFSGWTHFMVGTIVLASPTPTSPPSGTPRLKLPLSLAWTNPPYVASLQLQIAASSYFNTILLDSTISHADSTIVVTTLPFISQSTYYAWRIRATDLFGTVSDWSTVRTFSLDPPSAPPPPLLLSPHDSASQSEWPVMLAWSVSQYAESYRAQVASDSLFMNVLFDSTLASTATSVGVANLAPASTYYWRIQAGNNIGLIWSAPSSFRIIKPVAVPEVLTLEQNYPNPFNPTTTIRFSVPSSLRVTLKLFNSLGQEVRTITDTNYDKGWHEVGVDGTGLASGVYFYRIQAGGNALTRNLVVVH